MNASGTDEMVVTALQASSPWQKAYGLKRMDEMREGLEAVLPMIEKAVRIECARATMPFLTADSLILHAGQMTAGEARTGIAVAKAIRDRIMKGEA